MSSWVLLWAMFGCSCHPVAPTAAPAEAVRPPPTTVPAGTVVDGVFVDDRYGFSIPVPGGWTATPGLAEQSLRVTLVGPQVSVEVRVYPGGQLEPAPRDGCVWTFTDTGPYRALRVAEGVLAATCTPDDPAAAHVFAYLSARQDAVYQVEVHAAPGAMAAAKDAGDKAVSGLRW